MGKITRNGSSDDLLAEVGIPKEAPKQQGLKVGSAGDLLGELNIPKKKDGTQPSSDGGSVNTPAANQLVNKAIGTGNIPADNTLPIPSANEAPNPSQRLKEQREAAIDFIKNDYASNKPTIDKVITSPTGDVFGGRVMPVMDNSVLTRLLDPNGGSQSLERYRSTRLKNLDDELDQRKKELEQRYPIDNQFSGGIMPGVSVGTPTRTKPEEYNSELDQVTQDINNRREKLLDAVRVVASSKVVNEELSKGRGKVNSKDIGKKVRKIIGDPTIDREETLERKGVPLTPSENYYNDLAGYTALNTALNTLVENGADVKTNSRAKALLDNVTNSRDKLLSDNKPFVKQQVARAISDKIYRDKNWFQTMTGAYNITDDDIKRAGEDLGIDRKYVDLISQSDLHTANIFGTFVNELAVKPGAAMGAALGRPFRKHVLGQDPDVVDAHYDKLQKEFTSALADAPDADSQYSASTRVQTDPTRDNFLQDVKNDNAGAFNWHPTTIANTISGGIGQMMQYGVGGSAAGGALKGIGLVNDIDKAKNVGLVAYGFMNAYDNSYQQARQVLGNEGREGAKNAFATVRALTSAFTELIFPDYKVTDKLFGSGTKGAGMLIDNIAKNGAKALTEETVKKSVKAALKEGLINTVSETAKEVGEEEADLLGDIVTSAIFNKKSLEGRDIPQEAIQTAVQTAISSAIPIGLGNMRHTTEVSPVKKSMIYSIGADPATYISEVHDQVENKKIPQEVADRKIKIVNTMANIVSRDVPEISTVTGQPLSEKEKIDYAHNLLHGALLKEKLASTTDDVQHGQINNQLNDLKTERLHILSQADGIEKNLDGEPVYERDRVVTLPVPEQTNEPIAASTSQNTEGEIPVEAAPSPVGVPESNDAAVVKNNLITNQTEGGQNAIQEQSPTEDVLRNEGIQREGGLQQVGAGNTQHEEATGESQVQQEEIAPAQIALGGKTYTSEPATNAPEASTAADVRFTPIKNISTDVERFQPRGNDFSQASVDKIINDYDSNKLDPIVTYDEGGKTYVLAGHSRLEAHRQLTEMPDSDPRKQKAIANGFVPGEIKSRSFSGTEAEAREFADRSNDLGTKNTDYESAASLRKMREGGATKNDVTNRAKTDFGKNWRYLYMLSYLNPKGKLIQALRGFQGNDDVEVANQFSKMAQWIGAVRERMGDLITNAHENEMMDYLMFNAKAKKLGRESDFFRLINSIAVGTFDYDPSQPLNLNRIKNKSEAEVIYESEEDGLVKEIEARQKDYDNINDRLNNPKNSEYVNPNVPDYQEVLKAADARKTKLKDELVRLRNELTEHRKNKGKVLSAGIGQIGLFDIGNVTPEEQTQVNEELAEDGITINDIQDYENSTNFDTGENEEQGNGEQPQTSLFPENVQEPQNDEGGRPGEDQGSTAIQDEQRPEQREQQRPGRSVAERRKIIKKNQALKEFKQSWQEQRNTLGMNVNPELLAKGIKLVGAYIDLGVYKFGEIMKDVLNDIGDRSEEFLAAMKSAYGAYASAGTNGNLDDVQTVRDFTFDNVPPTGSIPTLSNDSGDDDIVNALRSWDLSFAEKDTLQDVAFSNEKISGANVDRGDYMRKKIDLETSRNTMKGIVQRAKAAFGEDDYIQRLMDIADSNDDISFVAKQSLAVRLKEEAAAKNMLLFHKVAMWDKKYATSASAALNIRRGSNEDAGMDNIEGVKEIMSEIGDKLEATGNDVLETAFEPTSEELLAANEKIDDLEKQVEDLRSALEAEQTKKKAEAKKKFTQAEYKEKANAKLNTIASSRQTLLQNILNVIQTC